MSYCRWSTDDYRCDLYVYEGGDGWHCHVAGGRRDWEPLFDEVRMVRDWAEGRVSTSDYCFARGAYHAAMSTVPWTYHDEPSTGWDFVTQTPGEMAARMRRLRGEGFSFPDHVLEALEDEQRELLSEGR